jgi:hypothetical protein
MEAPIFCARCFASLTPGAGNFYVVSIEAVADPTASASMDSSSPEDLRRAIADVLEQLKQTSEQEALDQVYRRVTLHLCGRCFAQWIENPAGS